jgi:Cu2+-exporting ATPase
MERTAMQHSGHHHHATGDAALPGIAPAAHDKHAGHSVKMFRDRFWLALAPRVPTVIWEPMIPE